MPTYTYSGDPASSPLDEVRFLLSDTQSPWMLSNEEINYGLARTNADPWATASTLAVAKSSYYSRRGNISIDGISLNYGDRGRALLELAQQLEKNANKNIAGPPVEMGGINRQFDLTDNVTNPLRDYPSVFDKLDYPS